MAAKSPEMPRILPPVALRLAAEAENRSHSALSESAKRERLELRLREAEARRHAALGAVAAAAGAANARAERVAEKVRKQYTLDHVRSGDEADGGSDDEETDGLESFTLDGGRARPPTPHTSVLAWRDRRAKAARVAVVRARPTIAEADCCGSPIGAADVRARTTAARSVSFSVLEEPPILSKPPTIRRSSSASRVWDTIEESANLRSPPRSGLISSDGATSDDVGAAMGADAPAVRPAVQTSPTMHAVSAPTSPTSEPPLSLVQSAISPRRTPALIAERSMKRRLRATQARAKHLATVSGEAHVRGSARAVGAARRRAARDSEAVALHARQQEVLEAAKARRMANIERTIRRQKAHSRDVAARKKRVYSARIIQGTWRRVSGASGARDETKTNKDSIYEPFEKVRRLLAGRRLNAAVQHLRTIIDSVEEDPRDLASGGELEDTSKNDSGFEKLARVIQDKDTVGAARTMLAGLARCCEGVLLDPSLPPADPSEAGRVLGDKRRLGPLNTMARSERSLLASILIARFPHEMLRAFGAEPSDEDDGSVESKADDSLDRLLQYELPLVDAARELVAAIALLGSLPKRKSEGGDASVVVSATRRLRAAWTNYGASFVPWKRADGERLAHQIRPVLLKTEIERRRVANKVVASSSEHTGPQSPADAQVLLGLSEHCERLKRQLRNCIPGTAKHVIKEVELQADKASGTASTETAKVASATPPTRGASSGPSATAGLGFEKRLAAEREALENAMLVHRLCLDPSWRLPVPDADAALHPDAWSDPIAAPEVSGAASGAGDDMSADPSASTATSLFSHPDSEQSSRAARRLPSLWLAKLRGANSAEDPIQAAIAADALRVGLTEITETLASLAPRRDGGRLATELRGLDVDHMCHQVASAVYSPRSWCNVVAFVASKLRELEAPARNANTDAVTAAAKRTLSIGTEDTVSVADLARGVAWMFWKTDVLRIDVANFHLSTLAPHLNRGRTGADYERKRFDQQLSRGLTSLAGTKQWLAATVANVGRDQLGGGKHPALDKFLRGLHVDDSPSRYWMLCEGLLQVMANSTPLSRGVNEDGSGPETFSLDVPELERVQDAIQRVALNCRLAAAVMAVVRGRGKAGGKAASASLIGRGVETEPELHAAIDMMLHNDDVSIEHVKSGLVLSAKSMAARKFSVELTADDIATLEAAAKSAIEETDPLFGVFLKRSIDVVRQAVRAAAPSPLQPHSCAGDLAAALQPSRDPARTPGLGWAVAELQSLGSDLATIIGHNEAVFGGHYVQLLREISGRGSAEPAPVADGAAVAAKPDGDDERGESDDEL